MSARRKLQQRRVLRYSILLLPFTGWIVLLLGILYLSQYHAWLIDAKRESLRVQGEIIAAAIAANVSVATGRMVRDPEQVPEFDAIDALQLSIVPERVTPILRKLVSTLDTRARVYRRDGTLISDTANFGFMIPAHREDSEIGRGRAEIRNAWSSFLSWLLREKLPVYREISGAHGTSYPKVRNGAQRLDDPHASCHRQLRTDRFGGGPDPTPECGAGGAAAVEPSRED